MELRPGYKLTEIGVIPEDWRVMSLENVAAKQGLVRGPFGGTLKKEFFVKQGYKVYEQRNAIYRTTQIGEYFINTHKMKELSRFQTHPGDLIVSCSGTIGCIYKIPAYAPQGVINQALLKITLDERLIDSDYFLFLFRSAPFQERITENSHGGAMQNLVSMEVFKRTPLPLPPTKAEQQSIAEALSDADALIESLEQLIAKKRQLKQGAMQVLLTGKKRLPGFSGQWEVKRLGDIGPFSKGRGIKRDDVSADGLACIRYGELYTRYHDYVIRPASRITPLIAFTSQPIKTGDLLFAGSGETAEEIGKCAAYLGEEVAYAGGDIIILRPIGQNSLYLGHLMNHETVAAQKARMAQGDAVVHISSGNLAQIEVNLPPLDEQTAIAAVLYDMDAEIAALETKLVKARQIKQGMMYNLLSGRIRLV